MDGFEVTQKMKQAGLEKLAPDIGRLAQESIRLTPRPLGGATFPAGASRLGGQPDLPPGNEWPRWKGAPMAFVAQIRLEDAKTYDPTGLLPDKGQLSFFYDSSQETYGESPQDRGGWQVLYFTGDPQSFTRMPWPTGLPAEARFKPCSLAFSRELTLPSAPQQIDAGLKWSEDEVTRYEDFQSSFAAGSTPSGPRDRMFGYPDQIQDDMQLQSALMANGVDSLESPRAAALQAQKSDWWLLLQVDTDERIGMRWGSAGRLYYWIERQALKDKNFDNTWLVLQSD